MNFAALLDVKTTEAILKLFHYGLRISTVYALLDGKISQQELSDFAKANNFTPGKRGRHQTTAPLKSHADRMMVTAVYTLYTTIRDKQDAHVAELACYIYETMYHFAKQEPFRRHFTPEEILRVIKLIDNGQLHLAVCKGGDKTPHKGIPVSYVYTNEEQSTGLCPVCQYQNKRKEEPVRLANSENTGPQDDGELMTA